MAGSLRPSEAKSGQLLDDADVTIKQARFVRYDWPKKDGTRGTMRLALALTLIDTANQEHVEYLSAGDLKFFVPTADGKGYDCVGDKTVLYKSTNTMTFLDSLVRAGFPENRLDSITAIEGVKVHIVRQAQPKRKFADGRMTKDDATVLVVSKLIALAGGPTDAIEPKAVETVQRVLNQNGGRFESAKLGTEVFKALMTDGQRNDVLKLMTPDFLAKHSGTAWVYDAQAGLLIAQ